MQVRIFGGKMPRLKISEPLKSEFEGCSTELLTEQININALENYGTIKFGYNYLISINETIFGTIIKVFVELFSLI